MQDDSQYEFKPGFWRNASRSYGVYGIPAPMFMLYLFWFRFPCWMTLYIVTGVIAGFRVLSFFGWTLQVLGGRLAHIIRGNRLSGRPWWYRRFTEED